MQNVQRMKDRNKPVSLREYRTTGVKLCLILHTVECTECKVTGVIQITGSVLLKDNVLFA